ncbi:MAG: HDOD domain-containing protein [Gammaproteobacteria bacterium]|nr:HDOD domain-containing protein [Gammaproteobacteria bacterium]
MFYENQILAELVRDLSIPSLPLVATQIAKATNSDDFESVVRLIESDAVIAMHTLRLANSAFYTRDISVPIKSVSQAVTRVGMAGVASQLVVREINCLGSEIPNINNIFFKLSDYWLYSTCISIGAGIIHQGTAEEKATCIACGLLHNLGELLLLFTCNTEQLRQLAEVDVVDRLRVEKTLLGFNSAELGSATMDCWGLDRVFVNAALFYNNPEKAPSAYRAIIRSIWQSTVLQQCSSYAPPYWKRADRTLPESHSLERAEAWWAETEGQLEILSELVNLKM